MRDALVYLLSLWLDNLPRLVLATLVLKERVVLLRSAAQQTLVTKLSLETALLSLAMDRAT